MDKLNKTFKAEQISTADEMNQITSKIDDVIDFTNGGGVLRKLYINRGAVYNEETGFYELNGITDIDEEEMLNIYTFTAYPSNIANYKPGSFGSNLKYRTNFKPRFYSDTDVFKETGAKTLSAYLCNNFTVLTVESYSWFPSNNNTMRVALSPGMFYYCHNLTKVLGIIDVINNELSYSYSYNLPVLESINIKGISKDFYFLAQTPKVNLESLTYLIDNAINSDTEIKVYVADEVYSKLTDTENTEWNALYTAANNKNIIFTTLTMNSFYEVPVEDLKMIDTEWEYRRMNNDQTKALIHTEILDKLVSERNSEIQTLNDDSSDASNEQLPYPVFTGEELKELLESEEYTPVIPTQDEMVETEQ